MNNPFDNESGEFVVLINDEGQHSLWPTFREAPKGWRIAFGEGGRSRAECLGHIEQAWTDIRPLSLRA
ncbi:MbtH family protein [Tsukamurella strandjordii]|uniref:MbtH family protein n=1 Tax=Tsukamurella strandjordii TaxID=147577 RepID=A0AA90NG77_9ACTN|nr:MbtH family protein [Tsukamurella strandjordii]MDP0399867.1 MbtH family protein [Tsukamurella strandjordii]